MRQLLDYSITIHFNCLLIKQSVKKLDALVAFNLATETAEVQQIKASVEHTRLVLCEDNIHEVVAPLKAVRHHSVELVLRNQYLFIKYRQQFFLVLGREEYQARVSPRSSF